MDNKSKPDPNTRLGKYLRSKGSTFPLDAWAYRPPQDNYLLCVFCGNPHENIEVKIREARNYKKYKFVSDIYICSTCNTQVNAMEDRMFKHSEDESLFRQDYERVRSASVKRLQLYLEEGILEPNYSSYITHLNPKIERESVARYNKLCYGCQRYMPARGYIQAPQGKELYILDGGRLSLCMDCVSEREVLETDPNRVNDVIFDKDTCPACTQSYLVAPEEYDFRTRNDPSTKGQHMCPRCTYNNITTASHLPGSLYQVNRDPDDEIGRYIYRPCAYCQDEITIDQTLSPNFLLKHYISSSGLRICRGCNVLGIEPNICIRTELVDDGGMVWMFFLSGLDGKSLQALRRRSGEDIILETRISKIDLASVNDELDAIIIDILRSQSKQTKLNFEQSPLIM